MEIAVIVLSIILYMIMGIIVGVKQYKALGYEYKNFRISHNERKTLATLLGFIWPITLMIYIIRVVFFEKWI